jgi:predicted RNA-binding protein with RPS1 domain
MLSALRQAREGRLHILGRMNASLGAPRAELSPFAPRIYVMNVKTEKIREIIGPGGKVIRGIQEQTGVKIDIEDDGTVFVSGVDGLSTERALEIVRGLVATAEIGKIYTGKVVRTTDFGAFVEFLPGQDGMVHISQLADHRVERVEDVVRVGDEVMVMVTDIDPVGKVRLSRQAVLEGWTADEARERDRGGRPSGGGGGGDRGGRGGDRGGRSGGGGGGRRWTPFVREERSGQRRRGATLLLCPLFSSCPLFTLLAQCPVSGTMPAMTTTRIVLAPHDLRTSPRPWPSPRRCGAGGYVPYVWDRWLADPDGRLSVAALRGKVVGFAKLTFAPGPGEWWLEGASASPALIGRGIARIAASIRTSRSRPRTAPARSAC